MGAASAPFGREGREKDGDARRGEEALRQGLVQRPEGA